MHIKLKEGLAQRIVERTNKITNYPIIVMDKNGYIIASTNPARMYQKHGGAILAMSELKTIEISSSMLADFPNVTPGINLPIIYNGDAIGVIGIAGPLEDVRPLGEMVKMAAELVVEYMSMIDATRWTERKGEEFLLESFDLETPPKHIKDRASMLKIDVTQNYAIAIIASRLKSSNRELINSLKSYFSAHIIAEYSSYKCVIKLNINSKDLGNYSIKDNWLALKDFLENSLSTQVVCAIGPVYSNIVDLPKAFQSAHAALKAGKRLFPDNHFYQYSELEIPAIFEGSLSTWQLEKIHQYTEMLEKKDSGLIEVLNTWFDNDCDIKKTSEKLYVHANTLRYRIKRTEEICGLNLSNHKDRCRLYFSLIL